MRRGNQLLRNARSRPPGTRWADVHMQHRESGKGAVNGARWHEDIFINGIKTIIRIFMRYEIWEYFPLFIYVLDFLPHDVKRTIRTLEEAAAVTRGNRAPGLEWLKDRGEILSDWGPDQRRPGGAEEMPWTERVKWSLLCTNENGWQYTDNRSIAVELKVPATWYRTKAMDIFVHYCKAR